jgi:hypothetical protein
MSLTKAISPARPGDALDVPLEVEAPDGSSSVIARIVESVAVTDASFAGLRRPLAREETERHRNSGRKSSPSGPGGARRLDRRHSSADSSSMTAA